MWDGAINFCKPGGTTSAKALYRLRKLLNIPKSGHAGTLDPMATGVLVICTGRGTRLVEQWMGQPKVYRAVARLDVTSDSFDADYPMTPVEVASIPSSHKVLELVPRFTGRIMQVPPAISALKVNGQRAYRMAGKGKIPELAARSVEVHWLHILRYEWPVVELEMCCGRGTYVRSLIRDLGQALGTGGCLTALERRAVGPFQIEGSCTQEQIQSSPELSRWLVPMDQLVDKLKTIHIPDRY